MRALLPATVIAFAAAAPALAQTAGTAAPAVSASAPSAVGAGGLLQVLLWLAVVLALLAGTAWLAKRTGLARGAAGSVARVVGGVSVGNRERVLVVEVGDQWIVVGVAPGRVSALSTMPRGEAPASAVPAASQPNFPAWLKQTMDRRNAR
ncbi:flagellar biosynthetic protein FliO [Noviherbaspirillum aridicola]|nr:flagellar biosynthetic protein FliO [Noviherbaspirillum aridicola]